MKRLTTLAAALLLAAPLVAAEAPKTDTTQTQAAAPQDSPLVAAAKLAAKKRTGKVAVITNETLVRDFSRITTTDSQPAINLPSPDAALIAMQQKSSQPQAAPGAARPSPADAERQKRIAARAGRAEENGPYSDTPYVDEVTIAKAENPTSATTQNPTTATTQNPTTGQAQGLSQGQSSTPDQMQTKKP